ncbi:hypothetical protein [Chitinophaga solisilvae]|uniref:hypothetical protein n=1 Tax=Chitinophaga solisilvae TaxID=1233460 RepID=UPI00136DE07F|nr:hypothetical protein [Chitinophaga solisilvae]
MDTTTAARTGARQSIVSLLLALTVLELFTVISISGQDLANNLIFLLRAQSNGYVVLLLLLLFTVTFFLGRQAGKDILLKGKHPVATGIKYALITGGVAWVYLLVIISILHLPEAVWNSILQAQTMLTLAIVIAWVFTARKIKATA